MPSLHNMNFIYVLNRNMALKNILKVLCSFDRGLDRGELAIKY